MKLSDEHWEPDTPLGRLGLEGQDLAAYQSLWDRLAEVDAIRAIADQDTDEAFETSGRVDLESFGALLGPDTVFLDIGCGIGRVLQHVAPLCREAHGVDISAEMVKRGEERLRHLPNVHLWHGNGYDLGLFEDNRFDVVHCGLVFQHMPRTTVYNYLVETHRVLKPEGVFNFQVPNVLKDDQFDAFRYFTQPYFVHHPYPMHFYTPAEIAKLAIKAGFWIEELSGKILVRARKREQAGVAPGAVEHPGVVEGDEVAARLLERARSLERVVEEREETIRALQAHGRWLQARLDHVFGHPAIRTGLALRNGLRRLTGSPRGDR